MGTGVGYVVLVGDAVVGAGEGRRQEAALSAQHRTYALLESLTQVDAPAPLPLWVMWESVLQLVYVQTCSLS